MKHDSSKSTEQKDQFWKKKQDPYANQQDHNDDRSGFSSITADGRLSLICDPTAVGPACQWEVPLQLM